MRGPEIEGKGTLATSVTVAKAEGGIRIPMDRDLREAVGYSWPVVMTIRVARLISSAQEPGVLCESPERQMRRVLWLAGIALRDMSPLARVAEFEIMLGQERACLGASFDISEGLAIHIDVVEGMEWGRGGTACEDQERPSKR